MNKIEKLKIIDDKDMENILKVWESSVRATHKFLDEKGIKDLIPQVKEGVKFVEIFLVVRNENQNIVAFEGIHGGKIEMLFVSDKLRGKGIGKTLILEALDNYKVKLVDVNEDNPQGVGFYQHMGFKTISRSETDEAGNPYPILHLELN